MSGSSPTGGGETVDKERAEKKVKELSLDELKEQRVELLPDRIELHHRRRRRHGDFNNSATAFNAFVVVIDTA